MPLQDSAGGHGAECGSEEVGSIERGVAVDEGVEVDDHALEIEADVVPKMGYKHLPDVGGIDLRVLGDVVVRGRH